MTTSTTVPCVTVTTSMSVTTTTSTTVPRVTVATGTTVPRVTVTTGAIVLHRCHGVASPWTAPHRVFPGLRDELALAVDAGVGPLASHALLPLGDVARRRGAAARVLGAWETTGKIQNMGHCAVMSQHAR